MRCKQSELGQPNGDLFECLVIGCYDVSGIKECMENKAGYTATLVACGWAGAVLEKVTWASGQELYAQKAHKRQKRRKGTDRPTN